MNPEAYGSINERIFKLMHLHQHDASAVLAAVELDGISTNTTAGLVRQQPSLKRRRAANSPVPIATPPVLPPPHCAL